jgi:hypothetical protein
MARWLSSCPLLGFALAGALAAPALASDGVLEINQTCATTTGCFAGDGAGFPVAISASAPARNVRLTSDLIVPSEAHSGIAVSVPDATVDLGGFRIAGAVLCSGVPVTGCTATGPGVGVSGLFHVTVKNGTVMGMGGDGLRLGFSSRAEDLNVRHNGGNGIVLGEQSIARGNIVTSNNGEGILCEQKCVVSENTATGNRFDGIDVGSGSVTGNTASLNGERGGNVGKDTTFAQNQFSGNVPPDQFGGHAGAGNSCTDGSCTRRGERRYYLTPSAVFGSEALLTCGQGFHMAHLAEILNPSGLAYDGKLGLVEDDAGSGPPSGSSGIGWIRTGQPANSFGGQGTENCEAWTSMKLGDYGSTAIFSEIWTDASTASSPWHGFSPFALRRLCAVATNVWCVED